MSPAGTTCIQHSENVVGDEPVRSQPSQRLPNQAHRIKNHLPPNPSAMYMAATNKIQSHHDPGTEVGITELPTLSCVRVASSLKPTRSLCRPLPCISIQIP